MRLPLWFRRLPAAAVVLLYLGTIAWFLGLQIIGDSPGGPLSYFFTWDMFPGYEMESARRIVLAETAAGEYVQLLPDAGDRFRWGNDGDATRFDLDRRDVVLDRAVRDAIQRDIRAHADEPAITRVVVAERHWPARQNGPQVVTLIGPPAGDDKSSHWRVVARADVGPGGDVAWKPAP